jgi:predicted amidohydrolase
MRGSLSIAVVQPPCTPRDVAANARTHAQAVYAARSRVVVFPELSLTGYELDAEPVSVDDPALAQVMGACAETGSVAFAGAPVEEGGRRYIAALMVNGSGVRVAYRKSHPGGDEVSRFETGDGPTVITVDGWRLGMAICRDTGLDEHTAGTAGLGVDAYLAGVVHRAGDLAEQGARGRRIAAACHAYVAFASFAGPTGWGYDATAGESTIWSPDGRVLARADGEPRGIARAELIPGRGGASAAW